MTHDLVRQAAYARNLGFIIGYIVFLYFAFTEIHPAFAALVFLGLIILILAIVPPEDMDQKFKQDGWLGFSIYLTETFGCLILLMTLFADFSQSLMEFSAIAGCTILCSGSAMLMIASYRTLKEG